MKFIHIHSWLILSIFVSFFEQTVNVNFKKIYLRKQNAKIKLSICNKNWFIILIFPFQKIFYLQSDGITLKTISNQIPQENAPHNDKTHYHYIFILILIYKIIIGLLTKQSKLKRTENMHEVRHAAKQQHKFIQNYYTVANQYPFWWNKDNTKNINGRVIFIP